MCWQCTCSLRAVLLPPNSLWVKQKTEQISNRLQPGWKSAVKITFSPKIFEVPEKGSFPNGTSIENVPLYMPSRLSYLHAAV